MVYVILYMILYITLYSVISIRCIQKIGKSPEIWDFSVLKKFFGLIDQK